MHPAQAVAFAEPENVPAAHDAHGVVVLAEYIPAAQPVHAVALAALYVPVGQAEQPTVLPGEYVPAVHVRHCVAPPSA